MKTKAHSYQIVAESKSKYDLDNVFSYLRRTSKLWCHYMDNVWHVLTTKTMEELNDTIVAILHNDGNVLITRFTEEHFGYLKVSAWDYFRKMLATEKQENDAFLYKYQAYRTHHEYIEFTSLKDAYEKALGWFSECDIEPDEPGTNCNDLNLIYNTCIEEYREQQKARWEALWS